MSDFVSLPRRIFLDSSTLQTLDTYGAFIWDGYEIESNDQIWHIPDGIENLEALRNIFIVQNRADFEFALSKNSFIEVSAKGDAGYLQWAYDVLDHWQASLESYDGDPFSGEGIALASKVDSPAFGYLGRGDRGLIRDAVLLECDAFLTMERRLPKNAGHIRQALGIRILTPIQYWDLLRPWARLYV